MGWWSASILGGDEPLDCLGALADICGVDSDHDEDKDPSKLSNKEKEKLSTLYNYAFTSEIINDSKTLKKMDDFCAKAYDSDIAYQVLGVILMATGAKIPKALKKKIIKAAKNDDWAQQKDEERISYIQSFIAALNNYTDGIPVYTTVEGLFQKISEKINAGTPGLVNKNV